jgi:hypothetical protein
MKKISLLICTFLTGCLVFSQSLERQVISSGGDYVTSGSVSLSYTVGEVATATLSNGNLILTQGFQQPDQTAVGIDETPFSGEIKVYPNPTHDIVIVDLTTDQTGLILELTSILGQQLETRKLDTSSGSYSGQVDMQGYAAGDYVLYLRDANGRVITTYKVQKIK